MKALENVVSIDRVKPNNHMRSPHWPTLRKKFLDGKICAVCGGKEKLEAHHIKPFHLHPELELLPSNLIALCEGTKFVNCHLFIGHLGSFKSFNPLVIHDAAIMNYKIEQRPK